MTMLRLRSLAAFGAFALAAAATAQPGPGPLFPEPFRVTHHLVQDDGDGSRFVGEPVVDTYGGSWIVSERPDGSRLVVDLARRELTEVRTEKGTYWTVSFDRFAELQQRLRAAQGLAPEPDGTAEKAAARPAPELVVTEVTAEAAQKSGTSLADRPGVRRLRVTRKDTEKSGAAAPLLDVWVDPSVRLTPAALGAVSSLETVLTGPDAADPAAVPPGRALAAVRVKAAGALPVRTVRPLPVPGAQVEDETTRLERLERFPSELAQIPEGLRRVPHPLESVVRFLEEDAERNAAMAGRKTGQKP
ncbi:MAG TPA: hypothetical protein VLT87_07260 [Thermoanaerobaculia bacterium]|nr:hypothetical protein [Thermoanaerobaculia bacterium]